MLLSVFVVLGGGVTHPPAAMDPHEEHELLLEIGRRIEADRALEAQREAERAAAEAAAAEQATEVEEQPVLPTEPAPPLASRSVWDRLADCESGNWVNGGQSFEEGSARWWWAKPGTQVPPWGTTIHHGGLQFHPGTWSSFKPSGYPTYAYDATREQQIAVAEKVLDAQGWGAWPTCARKLGLR